MLGFESPGCMRGDLASQLGFRKPPVVVIGGNDAVLAAYSIGIKEPGDYVDVTGTCEISMVCLEKCYPPPATTSARMSSPTAGLTLYVMNAEGKAFEWFHGVFCREMTPQQYYQEFMPKAVDDWVGRESTVTYTRS